MSCSTFILRDFGKFEADLHNHILSLLVIRLMTGQAVHMREVGGSLKLDQTQAVKCTVKCAKVVS